MIFFILSFLAGDLYLQTMTSLPNNYLILLIGTIVFLFQKKFKYLYLLLAFILGLLWGSWYASSVLSWSLPKEIEGKSIIVTGVIASLPIKDQWQTHFIFSLNTLEFVQQTYKITSLVKLSWRNANQPLKVGDKWRLAVRMKRIHSVQNPGGFDFEAWALQTKLRATGYVLANPKNILLEHHRYAYFIDHFRQTLQEKIQTNMPQSATSPWLMALIIGERNGINQKDWQVLRNTGTNHLMAIAGLHIGIISGFAYAIISWLWRRMPYLVLRFPAQQAGWCAALLVAIFYSALAGFSIPTQRASIMLGIFILVLLAKRKINTWHSWSLALLSVLIINPLSVLMQSFWLSFGTIALIIYGMSGRLAPNGLWWKWGRVQWVIGFGLIPLSLLLFQECSLTSFIANSIAIPWLGFLILPLCFLSAPCFFIYPPAGKLLLFIADKNLSVLWIVLTWFSELTFSSVVQSIPSYQIFFLTICGFIILLFPAGLPGRWLGILWLLPLLSYQSTKPARGDIWLTTLDVGQGLSVIVQTREHILIYDAGAKFNDNYDMGESVVLPYLRTISAKNIDMLVVSHGDNDHIGGVHALLKNRIVKSIRTSVPEKIPTKFTDYCLAGQEWQWDGVDFKFIYPARESLNLGNDSSCVLRISNGKYSVLLTGDIEKYAENYLLINNRTQLAATILIAPHHGSKTSGVKDFISAVQPQFVIYPIGYRNRYHFPHQSIIKSYTEIAAQQFNTAEAGAIQFKLSRDKEIFSPSLYRVEKKSIGMISSLYSYSIPSIN